MIIIAESLCLQIIPTKRRKNKVGNSATGQFVEQLHMRGRIDEILVCDGSELSVKPYSTVEKV